MRGIPPAGAESLHGFCLAASIALFVCHRGVGLNVAAMRGAYTAVFVARPELVAELAPSEPAWPDPVLEAVVEASCRPANAGCDHAGAALRSVALDVAGLAPRVVHREVERVEHRVAVSLADLGEFVGAPAAVGPLVGLATAVDASEG